MRERLYYWWRKQRHWGPKVLRRPLCRHRKWNSVGFTNRDGRVGVLHNCCRCSKTVTEWTGWDQRRMRAEYEAKR